MKSGKGRVACIYAVRLGKPICAGGTVASSYCLSAQEVHTDLSDEAVQTEALLTDIENLGLEI
jgi:hypothetical protein